MASSNPFFGLDAATLTTLKTAYINALTAVAANQSYSLNGKSVSRADLGMLKETLGQIVNALAFENDETTTQTFVSFTGL